MGEGAKRPLLESGYARSSLRKDAVWRAVEELRDLIHGGRLLPGEHIRQQEIAQELKMSRVPVREALNVLATEGSVSHDPNRGYFVTRMGAAEVVQTYRMRELLETELLSNICWPGEESLEFLRRCNEKMATAFGSGDSAQTIRLNEAFHFAIFDLSPDKVIVREVRSLWGASSAYRALYHYNPGTRDDILQEHDQIIGALVEHDREHLIELCNCHRSSASKYASSVLQSRRSPGGLNR